MFTLYKHFTSQHLSTIHVHTSNRAASK